MKKEYEITLGKRVNAARKNAGYTSNVEVAKRIKELAGRNITQQALSKLESGKSTSSWTTPYLAELYKVSAYWLVSGKPSTNSVRLSELENMSKEDLLELAAEALKEASST